jgi:hypothetical protein
MGKRESDSETNNKGERERVGERWKREGGIRGEGWKPGVEREREKERERERDDMERYRSWYFHALKCLGLAISRSFHVQEWGKQRETERGE